jgi:hypothetical protein
LNDEKNKSNLENKNKEVKNRRRPIYHVKQGNSDNPDDPNNPLN